MLEPPEAPKRFVNAKLPWAILPNAKAWHLPGHILGCEDLFMAVDNAIVRIIIDTNIAVVIDDGSCCGKYFSAWMTLKAWRDQPPNPGDQPNSLDLNVAAAENYMFARAMVCAGRCSRFQMNTLALGYYATKLIGIGMPTSSNPQSEPDWRLRDGAVLVLKRAKPTANAATRTLTLRTGVRSRKSSERTAITTQP